MSRIVPQAPLIPAPGESGVFDLGMIPLATITTCLTLHEEISESIRTLATGSRRMAARGLSHWGSLELSPSQEVRPDDTESCQPWPSQPGS